MNSPPTSPRRRKLMPSILRKDAREEPKGSDRSARMMYSKVDTVRVHFHKMNAEVEKIAVTETKLAARYEALAKSLCLYGEAETPGVRDALGGLADMLVQMQEHRRALAHQLTTRVSLVLEGYSERCRMMALEIDSREQIKRKHGKKQAKLSGAQQSLPLGSQSEQRLRTARAGLSGLSTALTAADGELARSMLAHERRKLEELKQLTGDLVTSQMVFCARGLEDLTGAHASLAAIEPETDLQDITRLVRSHADGAQPRDLGDLAEE